MLRTPFPSLVLSFGHAPKQFFTKAQKQFKTGRIPVPLSWRKDGAGAIEQKIDQKIKLNLKLLYNYRNIS